MILWGILSLKTVQAASPGECIANEDINKQFALIFSDGTSETYEVADDSCCQQTICGLGCPEEISDPSKGKLVIKYFENTQINQYLTRQLL